MEQAATVGSGVLVGWRVGVEVGGVPVAVATGCPHDSNLNLPMRVFQLLLEVADKYSVVYQKVQSSVGSTTMPL